MNNLYVGTSPQLNQQQPTAINNTVMASKKGIVKGKFIFPRQNNQNFPSHVEYTKQSPQYTVLPNNFSHNAAFMSKFVTIRKKDERMALITKHLQHLKLKLDNCYVYDDTKNKLVQISEDDANLKLFTMCQKRINHYKLKTEHTLAKHTSKHTSKPTSKPTSKAIVASRKDDKLFDDLLGFSKGMTLLQELLPMNLPGEKPDECFFPTEVSKFEVFSMIHNFVESFCFNVWSGSHKFHGNLIHKCSMVQLHVPADKRFFILFHGNLIHSGAPAKLENEMKSFNYAQDVRFFSYIHRTGQGDANPEDFAHNDRDKEGGNSGYSTAWSRRTKQNQEVRRSKRQRNTTTFTNHSNDAAVGISIKKCNEFSSLTSTEATSSQGCSTCDDMYRKIGNMYPVTTRNICLDIGKCYEYLLKKNTNKKIDKAPLLVAGDLNELGWAVYTGMEHDGLYPNMFAEVHDLIHLCPDNRWRNINSNRLVYNLDSHLEKETHSTTAIKSYYDEILNKCLRKVPLFEKCNMNERFILRNLGRVPEQNAHRDYEAKAFSGDLGNYKSK